MSPKYATRCRRSGNQSVAQTIADSRWLRSTASAHLPRMLRAVTSLAAARPAGHTDGPHRSRTAGFAFASLLGREFGWFACDSPSAGGCLRTGGRSGDWAAWAIVLAANL